MSESSGGTGMQLHTKIMIGLVVGAALGMIANATIGAAHPLVEGLNHYVAGPIGQIFLRMLFMIVIPLVFSSIALGVANLGDIRRVGRVGSKTLAYFFLTTTLAVLLGLVVVSLARPGERIPTETRTQLMATYAGDASSKVEAAEMSTFGVETIVNIVPRNPIRAAADLDLLGTSFFGLIFGAALTMIAAEKAKPMISWLDALGEVVIKIVGIAMNLAPIGVACLIFGVTSRFGFELLALLGWYVVTVIVALLLHVAINISTILRVMVGISPALFFKRIRGALVTAFSTSSSSATLPTALETAEKNLGVPASVAGFVLPLGSTMCMHGTALFEGITVITLAQAFGVDLSLGQMGAVMVMCVITAIGAAGVPGGSIPLLVGVMTMFKVPGEGIALILGVDRVLDMARTTVNVCGDLSAAVYIGKSEGLWSAADVPAIEGAGKVGDAAPGAA